jgi:hypothetical protein
MYAAKQSALFDRLQQHFTRQIGIQSREQSRVGNSPANHSKRGDGAYESIERAKLPWFYAVTASILPVGPPFCSRAVATSGQNGRRCANTCSTAKVACQQAGLEKKFTFAEFDGFLNQKLPRRARFQLHALKFIDVARSHVTEIVAYRLFCKATGCSSSDRQLL